MRTEIKQLQRRLGTTAVYVTHDQVEAMTMADRVVVMQNGHIEQVAPPIELYEKPANRFVAEFIGAPSMNFLAVTVAENGAEITLASGQRLPVHPDHQPALFPYFGQKVVFGIRPEHTRGATAQETGSQIVSVVQSR